MRKVHVADLTDNVKESVGKEWMLVTAGTTDKLNNMTARWGGIGWLWNKLVAFVFIRPERYKHEFIEKNDFLTLDFLGDENKKIHAVCGSKSGRNIDNVAETGLKPQITPDGHVTFEQARLTLECRKLYTDMIKPANFIDKGPIDMWYDEAHGGFHQMYVMEIVNGWSRS